MPHVVNRRVPLTFSLQVHDAAWLSHKKPVRDTIGNYSVNLFRHSHVAAAQARFYMGYRDVQLLCHNRAGQRRIHITHHQHRIRPVALAELLKKHHDLACLLRVTAATSAHEEIWFGNTQFLKKYVVHVPIVMLPSMDDLECQTAMGT